MMRNGTVFVLQFSSLLLPRAGWTEDRRVSDILMRTTSDVTEASSAVFDCKELALGQRTPADIIENREIRFLSLCRAAGGLDEVDLNDFRIFKDSYPPICKSQFFLSCGGFMHHHSLRSVDVRKVEPVD